MTTLRCRWSNRQASLDGGPQVLLIAFILLQVLPLLFNELSVLLSPHKQHSKVIGIVAAFVIVDAIYAVLIVALVRRRRWAWLVLVLLSGSAVILSVFNFKGVVRFILDVTSFVLLMSSPMRRYVKRVNGPDLPRDAAGDGLCAGANPAAVRLDSFGGTTKR